MGYHTYSDICENVLTIGEVEIFQNFIESMNADYPDKPNRTILLNGWSIKNYAIEVGKKNKLLAYEFVKDKKSVFLINTSEYESVGEYFYVAFSPDRVAVEEFSKDFQDELDSIDIEDVDTVQQTL